MAGFWQASKTSRRRFPAYLDDYAFLIDALLELLQADWSNRYLAFAVDLAELLLEHFQDKEQGGFFFTADDHESTHASPEAAGRRGRAIR